MKNLCVLAAMSLLIVFTSNAQGVGFGIKGGLNMASLSGDDASDLSSRTGIHFGAYLRIKMGAIGLQPEAYYSVQGAKLDFGQVKETLSANYLNIPVLLRFSPAPIINFHVGPQFGILMSANLADEDIKDTFKSSDISAAVGVGLDFPFGLNFTLRYVKGLSSISEDSTDSVKGNTFQISLGYDLVKLGK